MDANDQSNNNESLDQQSTQTVRLSYVDGQLHGPGVILHPNQTPRITMTFHQGMLHGLLRVFTDQSQVIYQCAYMHNRRHGVEEVFNPETGVLVCRTPFDQGQIEGEACWFYTNGAIQHKAFYKKGYVIEGPFLYDQHGHLLRI